jgi:steroid 5-alpha reductase family enzyme
MDAERRQPYRILTRVSGILLFVVALTVMTTMWEPHSTMIRAHAVAFVLFLLAFALIVFGRR